jgi:hypothetical protein
VVIVSTRDMSTLATGDCRPRIRASDGARHLPLREVTSAARGMLRAPGAHMSAFDRCAAVGWLVACVMAGIAGCGARDDTAKTTAFVESYDRAMKKISSICSQVSKQVTPGEPLTPPQRAAFIVVYGRAAADVKLDDAPASLRACRDGANDAFAKLRSATAEVIAKATPASNAEAIGLANAAAPAVAGALRELRIVADNCKRDAQQIDPQPLAMSSPYFAFALSCL